MNDWGLSGIILHEAVTGKLIETKAKLILESPRGESCAYAYGYYEPRMCVDLSNLMVLKNRQNPEIIFKTEGTRMLFWYGKNRVNWSPDGRFIAMDIFPALKTGIKEYRDMKLVIDMRENRFTVFLIAGSAGHAVDFRKRGVVKIIPGKPEKKATAYTMVKNVSARLRDLLWADLHNIGETVEMIERGHWGHVMGYNNNNVNIYFKNSYVPWFYPDQTDKK